MTTPQEYGTTTDTVFREMMGLPEAHVETARRMGSMLFVVGEHADPQFVDWELSHLSSFHAVSRQSFEREVTRYILERTTLLYERAA